jgi:cellulose synthase/poly-beta-1,6-N-acetylglucosamine synthase-like glycosyltransferase
MLFNKVNTVCCSCIIGRGAEFGPGFVLVHSQGVVINGTVRGGRDVKIEHQVTVGAEKRQAPVLGDDVFIGAGAKILGPVTIGDGARVGANAVVVADVPPHSTVVGIPARVVRRRDPAQAGPGAGYRRRPTVASDGSTDETNDIVRSYADRGVMLLEFPTNRGKAAVLNDAFRLVKGDVVVLSDANTRMAPDAVRRLAEWFADPAVGVVCGKLALVDPHTGKNVDGIYWKYENFLKKCESRLGALLGTNGAIYAIRRDLFPGMTDGLVIDDFVIPLTARLRTGCRLQYDPQAVASEETPAELASEFRRRARIGAGGYQAIGLLWPLLNPRHGWVALTFLSHKVLRWLCPFFLLAGLVLNVALLDRPEFRLLFGLQVGFYVSAAAAHFLPTRPRVLRYLKLGTMFVLMNAAVLVGFFRWVTGRQGGTWQRTARAGAAVRGAES